MFRNFHVFKTSRILTDHVTESRILFYPTLIWAFIDKSLPREAIRTTGREQAQDEEAPGEREPLLR
jgi:hypothetical protein